MFPEPRGSGTSKAAAPWSTLGKTVARGAGLGIVARMEEDGPETWEASYLHLRSRCNGGPVTNLRLVVGQWVHPRQGEEEDIHQVVGHARGTTGAVAEREEESEDCIVARTLGNRKAPGPNRAKAVRVGVNFWRAP